MPHERSVFSLTLSWGSDENFLWTLNFIFGCRHRNGSRPFTFSRRTYEVCLHCGRQVPYSLETMSPNGVGHSMMQPTQTYVIESSRLPVSPPLRLLSRGFRALPGSRIRNQQLARRFEEHTRICREDEP